MKACPKWSNVGSEMINGFFVLLLAGVALLIASSAEVLPEHVDGLVRRVWSALFGIR